MTSRITTAVSITLAGMLCFSSLASADPGPEDAAVFKLIFATTSGRQTDVPFRRELADALHKFWRGFNSSIPRNSPSETEWLLGELNNTDTNRFGRAAITPQYALRELSALAEGCLSDAALLQSTVGGRSIAEMYAWMRMVGCYNNPAGTEEYLKRAGLSKGLFDGPVTMAHATMLHSLITGKIANTLVDQAE